MPLAPLPTFCRVAADPIILTNGQAGLRFYGFFPTTRPAGLTSSGGGLT
jgi:hypothetical protein